MSEISISTRAAQRIRRGHLWVYRSDLRAATGAHAGEIVRLADPARNFVGQAFYSDASQIALRILSTREENIDLNWWRRRLRQCAARRAEIAKNNNAYRLVYSEGDLLPSIIVDVYGGHFVVQTLSQGASRVQDKLVELIIEQFEPRSVLERNDARVRQIEGLELRTGVLWTAPGNHGTDGGLESIGQIKINQDGMRFIVELLSSQKTGAFLDQRENYLAARRVAHGRALDCFTFNGGFALHVAQACDSVLGIDVSDEAVAAAQRNAELNGITNVQFEVANVFDALRELEAIGHRFDTIILDPPAFTKSRATIKSGARGYKEINLRALKLLNPGGVLVSCTCSYHISEEMFLGIIADAALDAHRRLQIIEKRGQSSDHPVLLGVPETHYLKCVIARVME
jgi:23S rRNA (cytosine1962-C5)-methyltransferase